MKGRKSIVLDRCGHLRDMVDFLLGDGARAGMGLESRIGEPTEDRLRHAREELYGVISQIEDADPIDTSGKLAMTERLLNAMLFISHSVNGLITVAKTVADDARPLAAQEGTRKKSASIDEVIRPIWETYARAPGHSKHRSETIGEQIRDSVNAKGLEAHAERWKKLEGNTIAKRIRAMKRRTIDHPSA